MSCTFTGSSSLYRVIKSVILTLNWLKMRRSNFKHYLNQIYKCQSSSGQLDIAPIRDALSRCQRIETKLELDLDLILQGHDIEIDALLKLMECRAEDFDFTGKGKGKSLSSLKSAARRYHDFRKWEKKQ